MTPEPPIGVTLGDPNDWEDPDSPLVMIETYRKPAHRASAERRRAPIHTSGTGHKAKTPVAVFICDIPETDHDRIYDELSPNSLGWNISFTPPETRRRRTVWQVLIANAKGASQDDLHNEIVRRFGYASSDVHVDKIQGVGFIGGSHHKGVPHTGRKITHRGGRAEVKTAHPLR